MPSVETAIIEPIMIDVAETPPTKTNPADETIMTAGSTRKIGLRGGTRGSSGGPCRLRSPLGMTGPGSRTRRRS